jgi:hypothetical protein
MTSPLRHSSRLHNKGGFGAGLFPLHSPLLRESLLVSFPPLIDMLKFRGYSRLTSGLDRNSEALGETRGPLHLRSSQPRVVRLGHQSAGAVVAVSKGTGVTEDPRKPRCKHKRVFDGCFTDAEADVAPGETQGRHVRSRCRCSMCPAIHIK